jgi:hypothetical protein
MTSGSASAGGSKDRRNYLRLQAKQFRPVPGKDFHIEVVRQSEPVRKGDRTGAYRLVTRDVVISAVGAVAFWALIVGLARVTIHAWDWPLAIILGLAVLPLGLLGGIRRRS